VNRAVSVVVPAFGDERLLESSLPPLLAELRGHPGGSEVLVVDDTGEGRIARWLAQSFPDVRALARASNGGFARALGEGIAAARHELVFAMNSDVRVRKGFLAPLVERLAHEGVFAAVPRILLDGDAARIESLVRIVLERGEVRVAQPSVESPAVPHPEHAGPLPVPFPIGGACLLRKRHWLALGGFDPLFEPFYLEDLDLGWRAWRAGLRCVLEPDSIVEHHHRGTIGAHVPPELVRAAIEKNRLLFQWKHLDGRRDLEEHCGRLFALALEAWMNDEREPLVWLALALEQLPELARSRADLPQAALTFAEIARASDPFR
jgi:N-acetylglucosaminyl-diphospho-decaprenol L-rhamnosyltransferase